MSVTRPAIPEAVKRQLRQEAGFGCCICGYPIYDYQHIVPYAEDAHFRPEDMMVLCPIHHREATSGALGIDEQRAAKAQPFNLERGYVDGLLKVNQGYCAVETGTVQLVGDGCRIRIDGEALLELSLGSHRRLEVTITIYGQAGELIALIDHNEWITGDPLPWDLEAGFQYLALRRKKRDIALELDARSAPIQLRADLWKRGLLVRLGSAGIEYGGVAAKGGFQHLCLVGMPLQIDTKTRSITMGPGVFVSHRDQRERLRQGIDAWLEMNGKPTIGL